MNKFLSKKGTLLLVTILFSSTILVNGLQPIYTTKGEVLLSVKPHKAVFSSQASDIYVVNGLEHASISNLIELMEENDLSFYDDLIAEDDVILLKINEAWDQRGGTNTDVLKELIQAIVDHPSGFVGEIIVADNGQWRGSMDYAQNNAENRSQSTLDVVNMFSESYNVSTWDWTSILDVQVNEFSSGNLTDGYILYDTADPVTGLYVSYPKFTTVYGTQVSFKWGIWNGSGYEPRLKIINMPVLKSHNMLGVSECVKHYMGVESESKFSPGLANGHDCIKTGGMGTLLSELGLPTLNIVDAIWVNAHPQNPLMGPSTPYSSATRVNILAASTDPVALSYWSAKHILMPTATAIGYTDVRTLDPDNTNLTGQKTLAPELEEAFGIWLPLSRDQLINAGYTVTSDENFMNVYIYNGTADSVPPTITIELPENRTYNAANLSLNFTVDEPTVWTGYSLNGQSNVTLSGNTTLTGLADGVHSVVVFAEDAAGNVGESNTVYFTVDTTGTDAPSVSILSPENRTYGLSDVPLAFTVDEPTVWMGYSLDGQANVTITGNTTLTGLADGVHSVVVFAEDAAGNVGVDSTVFEVLTQTSGQFGNDEVGSFLDCAPANYKFGATFVTPISGGRITSVSAYLGATFGSDPVSVRAAIYTNFSGNAPIDLAAYSDPVLVSDWAWYNFTVNWEFEGDTPVWLGVILNGWVSCYYDSGDPYQWVYTVDHYPDLADPFGYAIWYRPWVGSIYATYVPTGPDTTPPTVSVISPENRTYDASDVPLTVTVNELAVSLSYSLDGQANVTVVGNTMLTGLTDGSHSVVVFAEDAAGNIGGSDVILFTVDTMDPAVSIVSPMNQTYPTGGVSLTFTVNEPTVWTGYSLNGQSNVTLSGNTTLTGLVDGVHSVVVFAEDAAGNVGGSNTVYFTVDNTSPIVSIISPENAEYNTSIINLIFTVDEPASWMGYNLNGQANITVTGNTTLSLSSGSYRLIVFATDNAGHVGYSSVSFEIVIEAFTVVSNSTISALNFSSQQGILEFVVSGPSGALGWTEVRLAKTLMTNVSGLKVYLDGTSVDYNVTSEDDVWVVYFEYEHSTHTVRLVFPSAGKATIIDFSRQITLAMWWLISTLYVGLLVAVIVLAVFLFAPKKTRRDRITRT